MSCPLGQDYHHPLIEAITMAILFVFFLLFIVFYFGLALLIYNTISIPLARKMYRQITKDQDK
jgi:hypothetical protein